MREDVYTTDDVPAWSSVLPAQDSAFGNVQFARLVQQHLGYQARLYVLRDQRSLIAYPFFVRPIPSLLLRRGIRGRLSDTASPDFTGPLAPRGAPQSFANEFLGRFSAFASSQGIVTEFIYLHPWQALTGALL